MRSLRWSGASLVASLVAFFMSCDEAIARPDGATVAKAVPYQHAVAAKVAHKDASGIKQSVHQSATGVASATIIRPIKVTWRDGEIHAEPEFLHKTLIIFDRAKIVVLE